MPPSFSSQIRFKLSLPQCSSQSSVLAMLPEYKNGSLIHTPLTEFLHRHTPSQLAEEFGGEERALNFRVRFQSVLFQKLDAWHSKITSSSSVFLPTKWGSNWRRLTEIITSVSNSKILWFSLMLPRLDLSSHIISLDLVTVTFYRCLQAALSPPHRKLVGMVILYIIYFHQHKIIDLKN